MITSPGKKFFRSSTSIGPSCAIRGQLRMRSAETCLATASTGTVILPRQISQNGGHGSIHWEPILSCGKETIANWNEDV